MEQADIDTSWIGEGGDEENYTITEPEFRVSQHSSPEHPFGKSSMDEYDFVDIEGDVEVELDRPTALKKKDVLEEGQVLLLYIYFEKLI